MGCVISECDVCGYADGSGADICPNCESTMMVSHDEQFDHDPCGERECDECEIGGCEDLR